jgi:hypothetical protein
MTVALIPIETTPLELFRRNGIQVCNATNNNALQLADQRAAKLHQCWNDDIYLAFRRTTFSIKQLSLY